MFGVDHFRGKHLVVVLEAVVDKSSVDRSGQAALWRLLRNVVVLSLVVMKSTELMYLFSVSYDIQT